MKAIVKAERIKIGDFIEVPAWNTFGCVMNVISAEYGSERVQCVLLQESPGDFETKRYHLEPGEYTIQY